MSDFDLSAVLDSCQKSANKGYRIASSQYSALRNTLRNAEEIIKETELDFAASPAYFSSATEMLTMQLSDVRSNLNQLTVAFNEDLEKLRGNLEQFTITVFGRTTAGKSTLMEILTKGNGESIGTGAQRTTKDVRSYPWNDLIVTDVPGIGAFEGQDDEREAFEAAKKADLILFLITSDGPQYAEAECFSRIVSLGKPVICVLNVRSAVSDDRSIKLVLRDIDRQFNIDSLNIIRNQFYDYAEQFGQNWNCIPMVYTHLKAAFFAQKTENEEFATKLYKASKIGYLKEIILQTVRTRGEYLRVKTFIDVISAPMLNTMESFITQSLINRDQGRTITSIRKQLETWKKSYERDSLNRIKTVIERIRGDLYSEIAEFAEDHYADKRADEAWGKLLNRKRIDQLCQSEIQRIDEQCNDKLQEVSRSMVSELGYISNISSDRSLQMHTIVNGRKIWNWGTLIVSSGLTIGSIVASLVGAATLVTPLIIGAAAVGAIGGIGAEIFKSRDKKEHEARSRLEKKLRANVDENCQRIQSQMQQSFSGIMKKTELLLKEIDRVNKVIFKLADTQKEMAWKLDDHLLELNMRIVSEALSLNGVEELKSNIKAVARIPGNMSCVMLFDGVHFPDEEFLKFKKLMTERVSIVFENKNKWVILSRMMGKDFDRRRIRIEQNIDVAHITGGHLSQTDYNKMRLAQQFIKLAIQIEEV